MSVHYLIPVPVCFKQFHSDSNVAKTNPVCSQVIKYIQHLGLFQEDGVPNGDTKNSILKDKEIGNPKALVASSSASTP